MNANDIIKALECCISENNSCKDCPYNSFGLDCTEKRNNDCIDLINRQKAEIEALLHSVQSLSGHLSSARPEAVKEFIKRFEKEIKDVKFTIGQTWEIQSALKAVEKEMVGDK